MDRGQKIIITLLSKIVGHLEGIPANEVLKAVLEQTEPKERKVSSQTDMEAVEALYKLYPTTCPISGRSLGKCSKNKAQIATLLKTRTTEDVAATIKWYIEECKKSNTYFKNFGTFLNQFPDRTPQIQETKAQQDAGGQDDFWNDPLYKEWAKEQEEQ